MKKLISLALSAALAAGMLLSFSPRVSAASYKLGDANGDGAVNAKDSYAIRSCLGGDDIHIDYDASDANRDGAVTCRDSLLLKLHLAALADLSATPLPDSTVGNVTIAGVDIGLFTVVVSDKENENMCFAAEELCKYIKKAADRTLLTEYGESHAAHRIELCADSAGVMGNDGFSITVSGGNLRITGGALRGTMYGVYTLLEEYIGYRFFGYYEEFLYEAAVCDIPEGTSNVQIPVVTYRCNCIDPFHNQYAYSASVKNKLSGATSSPSLLQARYGYGIERLRCNAHSLDFFVPKEKLTELGEKMHCLSSSSIYNACLEAMFALVDERLSAGAEIGKEITEISCSYSAENKFCICRKCSKVLYAEGSHSGILVQFVNKIDNALHEKYPNLRVMTTAYGPVRIPPKVSKLNSDVVLLYCWNGCANHKLGSGECSDTGNSLHYSNKVEESYYLGWSNAASQIYVWYYPTNIYYLLCPQPNLYNLYNDFQWFLSHKATGFYVVGTANGALEDMEAYLINRLMWDKDMSEAEYLGYISEYMRVHYGPGYESILKYTEMMTEAGDLMGCVLNDFEQPFDIYSKEYFALHFDEMTALFDNAMSKAETSGQRESLERLSVHMKFLGYSATYESAFVNGDSASREKFAAGWQALYNYINDKKILSAYDTVGIESAFTLEKSPMQLVYNIDGER